MADESTKPLLDRGAGPSSSNQSLDVTSAQSLRLDHGGQSVPASESTPLLDRRYDETLSYGARLVEYDTSGSCDTPQERDTKPSSRKIGPIFVAVTVLVTAIIMIIFSFATPSVLREYVTEATTFHPTGVSIDWATADGICARIQGNFVLDASRAKRRCVRDIGRLLTWIVKEVDTDRSEIQISLPKYEGSLVGTAYLPPIKVNIQNGYVNRVDLLTDLSVGDIQDIRAVAIDWLEGRIDHLDVLGSTTLKLKSGSLNLGTHTLSDTLILKGGDFLVLPEVNITSASVYDTNSTSNTRALAADVSLKAMIDFPFSLRVPRLGFEVLVPNCLPDGTFISVADASTGLIQLNPGQATNMDAHGLLDNVPGELTATCPGEKYSPLDSLMRSYIYGNRTTIYIRSAQTPSLGMPPWMSDITRNITVPLPFTGHYFGNIVRNFTMSEVHFSLPSPFADLGTPQAQLRTSALISAFVNIPKEMNFQVGVPQVRAVAGVHFNGTKFGYLVMDEWQAANSSLIEDQDGSSVLSIQFAMREVPLCVSDEGALVQVLQALILEGRPINLSVTAAVDAEISTGLGPVVIHDIPADAKVLVKPPYGGVINQLNPRIESVEPGSTTESSIVMETTVKITNPTEYSATIPWVDLIMLYNLTAVAHIVIRDVSIIPDSDCSVHVDLIWDPLASGGPSGVEAGRKMVSQYISGLNTTVAIQAHRGTIPMFPVLGEAISRLIIEVPLPKASTPRLPDDDDSMPSDDESPSFIRNATLHLFSSTAEFTLLSPLSNGVILITSIDATASYRKTEEIGDIHYQGPFQIPPGISQTPRLPVNLNFGGIGYSAVKRMLGSSLDISTIAEVGILIDNYKDCILYSADAISANIRI